ncbi:MAG: hypothetical protein L3K11_06265 [Thermoplasmata archaeon]|nr:hypothetical protein [Thermoplasmata archaeon]
MARLDGLLDCVWTGVGPECRELTREVLRIIDSAPAEDRPKLLACFFWVNWARERADEREEKVRFWEFTP